MADEFDNFFASALAPPERIPDRAFVARVQAGIALEDQLAVERRALIFGLFKQVAALAAVAASVWLIGHAPSVADIRAEAPALTLAVMLAAFALASALFSLRPSDEVGRFAPLTMLNGR